jgi:hypothetical protein
MSNEAAERLRPSETEKDDPIKAFRLMLIEDGWVHGSVAMNLLDGLEKYVDGHREALAAERRATVERMRPFFERLADYFDITNGDTATGDALRATWREAHDAILDEGAAR